MGWQTQPQQMLTQYNAKRAHTPSSTGLLGSGAEQPSSWHTTMCECDEVLVALVQAGRQ